MLKRGKVFAYIDRLGNLYIEYFGKVEIGKSYYKEWEESETERGLSCAIGGFNVYDFNHRLSIGDSENDIHTVGYDKPGFGFRHTRSPEYNDMMFCEIIVSIPDNANVYIKYSDENTSDLVVIESYNQIETDWARADKRCEKQYIKEQSNKLEERKKLLNKLKDKNKEYNGRYTEILLYSLLDYYNKKDNPYLEALDLYAKEIGSNFCDDLKEEIDNIEKGLALEARLIIV